MNSGKFGEFGLDLASKPFEKLSFCKGNPAETSVKSPIFSRLRRANKNKIKRTIYTIDSGRRRRPKIFGSIWGLSFFPPLVRYISRTRGGETQLYGLIDSPFYLVFVSPPQARKNWPFRTRFCRISFTKRSLFKGFRGQIPQISPSTDFRGNKLFFVFVFLSQYLEGVLRSQTIVGSNYVHSFVPKQYGCGKGDRDVRNVSKGRGSQLNEQ